MSEHCWRVEHADRVAWLIDGADFFRAFRDAAKNARESILILAWDIHSQFELVREVADDGLPTPLGAFLDHLVRDNERLDVHILSWDYAMLLAPDREWAPKIRLDWATHPRMHFELDDHHPPGASHHQKVVVVDDRVAFVGGLDFTRGRWDTPEHKPGDARRADSGDKVIPQPYHDVQVMVSGPVAASLGDLARERWRLASGESLQPPQVPSGHEPWPENVEPDLAEVNVGIARTVPAHDHRAEAREVEAMTLEAISGAREGLYIENQYLTSERIGEALGARLEEPDGPQIVLVLPEHTVGWLSQYTMDVMRVRLLQRLLERDLHGSLRLYYPFIPGLGEQCVNMHAKVLIADDRLLSVGSANLNNRSMGLDTECNLAIAADGDARVQQAIAGLRNRLMAEHLGAKPRAVSEALEREGSLFGAIDRLNGGERRLEPLRLEVSEDLDALVPDSALADPEAAMDADYLRRQLVSPQDRKPAKRALIGLVSVLILALFMAAAWRWTPLGDWLDIRAMFDRLADLRGGWLAPIVVSVVFIVGGLLMVPVTLMIIATGLAFGAVYGFAYAMLGAELSAVVTYAVGHWLGHDTVQRIPHQWLRRANRYLARQGLVAIITLRIVPVAPYSVINLVAGASHIGLRQFALGTVIGLLPGVFAFTLLSDQVVSAIQAPAGTRFVIIGVLIVVIALGAWGLTRWLTGRRKKVT